MSKTGRTGGQDHEYEDFGEAVYPPGIFEVILEGTKKHQRQQSTKADDGGESMCM